MDVVNYTKWGETQNNEINLKHQHYKAQIILILVVSSIGFFLDLFILHLYYITKCFYVSGQRIRSGFAPVTVSAIWLPYQLIKTSINYHQNLLLNPTFCQIDTIINVTLFEFFYMTIVIMSEVLSRDFSTHPMTNNDLFSRFIVFGIYSTIIGILSGTLPGALYSMDHIVSLILIHMYQYLYLLYVVLYYQRHIL